jgi:hypothetical protein
LIFFRSVLIPSLSQEGGEETTEQLFAEQHADAAFLLSRCWEVFNISLEEDTDKEMLAYIGAGFAGGGAALGAYLESGWCIIPMGAGIMNMAQAWYRHRRAVKDSVKALDKTTKDITKQELEQRIKESNYDLPPMTPETAKDMEMGIYAIEVAQAVAEKDYNIKRYPANLVGGGLLLYAGYQSMFQSAYAGVGTATAAGIVMIGAHVWKKRKIVKAAEKTMEFLKEKGYDYFDAYIRKKPRYDFYERFIKGKPATAG